MSRSRSVRRFAARALSTLVALVLAAAPARADEPVPMPPEPVTESGISREGRIALEALGGYAGAAVGAGLGFGLGLVAFGNDGEFGGLAAAVFGGFPGLVVGLPSGIYLTGEACGGDGNYWATWLGVLAGSVAPTITTAALAGRDSADTLLGIMWVLMPAAGGIIGYELSQPEVGRAVASGPHFSLLPTPNGMMATLGGTFR